jgi:hypothetical protein
MADDPKTDPVRTPPQAKLRYQDRPELNETFADSIRACVFDGQLMRIEFTATRFDDPAPAGGTLEGRQVPVARMVLSRAAVADLFNRMGQLSNALRQMNQNAADKAATGAPVPPTKQ